MDHPPPRRLHLRPHADADVADIAVVARRAEVEQVARREWRFHRPAGSELLVGVARDDDAGQLVEQLGKAGAVDAMHRCAAPEVGHADELQGVVVNHVAAADVERPVVGQRAQVHRVGVALPGGAAQPRPAVVVRFHSHGRAREEARDHRGQVVRPAIEQREGRGDLMGGRRRGGLAQVGAIHPAQVAVVEPDEDPALVLRQHLGRRAGPRLALLLAQPRRRALQAGQVGGHGQALRARLAQHVDGLRVPARAGRALPQVGQHGVEGGRVEHAPLQAGAAIAGGDGQFADVEAPIAKGSAGFGQRGQ